MAVFKIYRVLKVFSMNITKENIDDLNAILTVQLEKADYEEKVNTVLKDYRKKAKIDGFRPGKVPFGLINKMYRKPVLVEEVNKLVSQSISKYLVDEKLNILGDPLPNEEKTSSIDWDSQTDFEFAFDLGIAPEVNIKVSGRDKVPSYTILVDDAQIDKYVESYTERMGGLEATEASSEKSVITGNISELDAEGNVVEDGISVEGVSFSVDIVKDEKIQKSLIGVKADDVLTVDLKKAYPNDTELSGMLNITKEEVAAIENSFQVTVGEIKDFKAAEVNQELFDKIYGPETVKSEEEFRAKIAEDAAGHFKLDSAFRFKIDVKKALLKKFKGELPADFLKRWLLAVNQDKFTPEQVDEEFDKFEDDLKWQLIKDNFAKEQEMSVSEEEIKEGAIAQARQMFMQYGMGNVPDEHLESFAKNILEKQEEVRKIHETKLEDKVVEYLKTVVKVDEKEISLDDFNKLFEKDKK